MSKLNLMHEIIDKLSYQLVDAYRAKIWALVNNINIDQFWKKLAALVVNCESMIKVLIFLSGVK